MGVRVPDTHTIMDADILDGEAAFNESGCTTCHVPAMQTGDDHPVAQFRNIIIRPFTDLLLWDMGPELCAESDEGNADRCEWRTAPLWGLRLQEQVTGHASIPARWTGHNPRRSHPATRGGRPSGSGCLHGSLHHPAGESPALL